MPRYAVDFIAEIEELDINSREQAEQNYSNSEIKGKNNDSETEMGNVQCLLTVGKRPQNRRIVISRGIQCNQNVQPQLTSIRHENICTMSGNLSSDFSNHLTQSTFTSHPYSTRVNGLTEEVIMGRLPRDSSPKHPPELKENTFLKNKREVLLQKLQIISKDDDPDSLSDTLSDVDYKFEFRDRSHNVSSFQNERLNGHDFNSTEDVTNLGLTKPDNIANVEVIADENEEVRNPNKSRIKDDIHKPFKLNERGDCETRHQFQSDELSKKCIFPLANVGINQSNFSVAKSSSRYAIQTYEDTQRYVNEVNKFENHRLNKNWDPNACKLRDETPGSSDRPPKAPNLQPLEELERPCNSDTAKRFNSSTPRNALHIISPRSAEGSLERFFDSGMEDFDHKLLRPSRASHPSRLQMNEVQPSGRRSRSFSETKLISPRGFYYPSRIPQPVTQKFYVSETEGIGGILADTTDRRIKAVCDRHRCDIAVYSPIKRGGYMKYIVMLTAPSALEMKKCVRSLDAMLKWNLASQIK